MKIYKVVKCPHCYKLFITYADRRVRCRYCRRTFKIKDNTKFESRNYEDARVVYLTLVKKPYWIAFNP